MTNDINFLRERIEREKKRRKQLFFIQVSSITMLVLYGLGTLGLYAYGFFLDKERITTDSDIAQRKAEIEKLKPVETKQYYLKTKLHSLTGVLSQQKKNQLITEAVFAMLPEGISISGFDIDEKGGVRFSAQSKDFATLTAFFSNLETTPRVGELFIKSAHIDGVTYGLKKDYTFSIYLLFEG